MRQVDSITISELHTLSERMFGTLVKADVDAVRGVIVIDMDMHADGEAFLLGEGSRQEDLWCINLRPMQYDTPDFIEFDSMINIRPRQQNPSRDVLDPTIAPRSRRSSTRSSMPDHFDRDRWAKLSLFEQLGKRR